MLASWRTSSMGPKRSSSAKRSDARRPSVGSVITLPVPGDAEAPGKVDAPAAAEAAADDDAADDAADEAAGDADAAGDAPGDAGAPLGCGDDAGCSASPI